MKNETSKSIETSSAAHLALVEIVIGSLGHGFKIPFTGTMLSFYQLYICLGLIIRKKIPSIHAFNVSVIVALLKTLSPLGKKVTPMIAISMQGFLLWLGSSLFIDSWLGLIFGSILFVSWSLVQALIGFTLIYGFDFFKMIEFIQGQLGSFTGLNIYFLIGLYLTARITIALILIVYISTRSKSGDIWILDEHLLTRLKNQVDRKASPSSAVWKRAGKDLLNPLFFLSLILMVTFHFYLNSEIMPIVWLICRTLAIGYVIFYLIRSEWVMRVLLRFLGKNRRFRDLYKTMYRVRRKI